MEIAIDFDGTCVTHEFPKVGQDIGAEPVLKRLVDAGHKLILYTMRSDRPNSSPTNRSDIPDVTGMFLSDAVRWFEERDIPLHGIQTNPNQGWTTSPKCYAQLYIDDAALGAPLVKGVHERPYVDWDIVHFWLEDNGILQERPPAFLHLSDEEINNAYDAAAQRHPSWIDERASIAAPNDERSVARDEKSE